MTDDAAVLCLGCDRMTQLSRCSTSGPIKEIDEDGILTRRWFHVCPHCFSDDLVPARRAEEENDDDEQRG